MFECKTQNDTVVIAFYKNSEILNSVFSEEFIWLNISATEAPEFVILAVERNRYFFLIVIRLI